MRNKSYKESYVCRVVSALFPAMVFLYFGANNTRELAVWFTLLWTAIFILWGCCVNLLTSLVIRDSFSNMIFNIMCWVGFYAEPFLHSHLPEGFAAKLKDSFSGHGRTGKNLKTTRHIYLISWWFSLIFFCNN